MENKDLNKQQTQIAFVAGATGFIGRFLIAELLHYYVKNWNNKQS